MSFMKYRSKGFYLELIAGGIGLLLSVYYGVQSRIDGAFDLLFLLLSLGGVLAVLLHCFFRLDFLTLLAGVCFGVAFGVMVHDMLPTLSDVWNNVTFIGGNLQAYLLYTIGSFVAALLSVLSCFMGTEKEQK